MVYDFLMKNQTIISLYRTMVSFQISEAKVGTYVL